MQDGSADKNRHCFSTVLILLLPALLTAWGGRMAFADEGKRPPTFFPANVPAPTRQQRLRFNRDVRLYLVTAGLVGFCWIGIYLVLFNLYLLRLGYGPEFIGTVNAAGSLAYAVFSLPAGALGGRWGCAAR